ncbi:hypothetical protein GCM10027596_00250 [Nocardioides korecus]
MPPDPPGAPAPTQGHEQVATSAPGDGFWRGLAAGLVPNVVVFAVLYGFPWADEHVPDRLALTVLYAGPALVAVLGLVRLVRPGTRRRGAGLLLAAPTTVALWYVWVWVDAQVAMSSMTPGG